MLSIFSFGSGLLAITAWYGLGHILFGFGWPVWFSLSLFLLFEFCTPAVGFEVGSLGPIACSLYSFLFNITLRVSLLSLGQKKKRFLVLNSSLERPTRNKLKVRVDS